MTDKEWEDFVWWVRWKHSLSNDWTPCRATYELQIEYRKFMEVKQK